MEFYLRNSVIVVITIFFDNSASSNINKFMFVIGMFDNLFFGHVLFFIPLKTTESFF